MRIVKPRKTSLSGSVHIKSVRHISDPRFEKDKQCEGKKMPESGHILAAPREKGGFTCDDGTESPLSQVYRCFEAFFDKYPGVVYISMPH